MSNHDQILDAARAVVCRVGISAMTLSEVAREAGISRATMYRRFDSRDALIGALVTAELNALEGLLAGRMRFADEPRQAVYMLVREVLDANARNEPLQSALRIDGAALLPLLIRTGSVPTLVDIVVQRTLAHVTGSALAEKLAPDPEAAIEFMVSAIYAQLLSPGLYLSHGQLATYVSEAVVRD